MKSSSTMGRPSSSMQTISMLLVVLAAAPACSSCTAHAARAMLDEDGVHLLPRSPSPITQMHTFLAAIHLQLQYVLWQPCLAACMSCMAELCSNFNALGCSSCNPEDVTLPRTCACPAESVRLARSLRVHNPWADERSAEGQHGRKLAQSEVITNLPAFPTPGQSGITAAGVGVGSTIYFCG